MLLITAVAAGCQQMPASEEAAARTDARRGPIEITYEAVPGEAPAGTPISVTITATAAADAAVHTPLIDTEDADTWGAFEVLNASPAIDVPLDDGRHRWTQTVTIDSFQPGTHPLPALDVGFVDRRATTERTGSVPVEAPEVHITSSLPAEDAAMHDVVGWKALPAGPWWPWAVGAAAIAAVIGGGAIWVLSRSRPEGPPPTPADVAFASMSALSHRGLLARGELEPFYVALSDIVRRYIEGRFGLAAPRKTTAEFLVDAERDERLLESQRSHLRAFLRLADLVKFAGHEPAAQQGQRALDDARDFVTACEHRLQPTQTTQHMEAVTC